MTTQTTYSVYDCPSRDENGRLPIAYMAAVMLEADKSGVVVEYTYPNIGPWLSDDRPQWNWGKFNYRIRRPYPEPKKGWLYSSDRKTWARCWKEGV